MANQDAEAVSYADTLKDIVKFMNPLERADLVSISLTHVLSLSGSVEGKKAILQHDEVLVAVFNLHDHKFNEIAKYAALTLINLTAEEDDAINVLETSKSLSPAFPLISIAIKQIVDENSKLADPWTMVLSNLTRSEKLVEDIIVELENDSTTMPALLKAFTKLDYNKQNMKLHYLAAIFCNLTQSARGREIACEAKYDFLEKILPFASYEDNIVRRGGTIGILKNICFDPVYHNIILNEKDDILHAILYPLCGPEEFSDEENEKLPLELQYLPETKTREEDPDLRKMLLESLLQLCATKRYREVLRSKGVYEILREYHKWEAKFGQDKECLLACENVVDILIKKEEEIGLDNYREVEVPADVADKFVKEDMEYMENIL
ncbi:protein HGH1 homolog [Zeugodacus cucurbitae]|uniref:Protein HGH1 homolog n=1 Tax=Zeugodacus cucurbitae TaxID=28588 RepID=A0A0A1X838_ZEUCU|nr:protein HGH1 homolog [Zeugodacus cucurbitae]